MKHIGIGILAFILLLLTFGIPTAVIPSPWFSRMTPVRVMDYFFLVLNSGLLAAYVGLHMYQHQKGHKLATTGGIANIFAVSCPICNKIIVFLLGTSAALAYFEPLQFWIGLGSTTLAVVALGLKIRSVQSCKTCA